MITIVPARTAPAEIASVWARSLSDERTLRVGILCLRRYTGEATRDRQLAMVILFREGRLSLYCNWSAWSRPSLRNLRAHFRWLRLD